FLSPQSPKVSTFFARGSRSKNVTCSDAHCHKVNAVVAKQVTGSASDIRLLPMSIATASECMATLMRNVLPLLRRNSGACRWVRRMSSIRCRGFSVILMVQEDFSSILSSKNQRSARLSRVLALRRPILFLEVLGQVRPAISNTFYHHCFRTLGSLV